MTGLRSIDALEEIAGGYAAVFCDVWGVVHDGVRKHGAAEAALLAARRSGRQVLLLTNSPRPCEGVGVQLDAMGFSRQAYDRIVTSGDVTRALIASTGRRFVHVGPKRNEDLFEGLAIDLVDEANAEAVIVTGLFDDDTETPADYADLLERFRNADLPMICANPDVVVHRGSRLVFCAGAVAKEYEAMGGTVRMAGKPYLPIYRFAAKAAGVDDIGAILAVGDGLNTDIRGANTFGADALLILGGIHGAELGGADVEAARLAATLRERDLTARYFMPMLR